MRKGISKISLIVVILIVIFGIFVVPRVLMAYFWAEPIVKKQKERIKLETAEEFMRDLNGAILTVANEGGKKKIEEKIPGKLKLESSSLLKDKILLTLKTKGSMVAPNKTIYLKGDDRQEVPITAGPEVISIFSEPVENGYKSTIKLYYRNLTSNQKVQKIDLDFEGKETAKDGKVHIIISNEGERTLDGITLNEVSVKLK